MKKYIWSTIVAALVALGFVVLPGSLASAAPASLTQALPAGSFISSAPPAVASMPAAATAVKAYTKKNCWVGNKGNVETSNWGRSDGWQVYHVWVYRASWYTGTIGHYMDQVYKGKAPAEYYINVPDQATHRQGARASDGSWCAYYQ